jgi:predicted DNA-binding protein
MAIQLSPEIQQRLEALARETGRSVAVLTREALFARIDAIEDFYQNHAAGRHDGQLSAPYGAEPDVDLGL